MRKQLAAATLGIVLLGGGLGIAKAVTSDPTSSTPPWPIVVVSAGASCSTPDKGLHATVHGTGQVVTCNGHTWS